MPDLNGILNMATRALMTQQRGINVTGHNIANVNTEGFTRQRVNMETCTPISSNPGQMGTGVQAVQIQRVYDGFLEDQIRDANQELSRWETQRNVLERAEMVFNESSGYGLNQAMSDFWNAWQDVSNNPSGLSERIALRNRSGILTDTFNGMYGELARVQKDTDGSIAPILGQINQIAAHIADLNQKISDIELSGQDANDMRDQRDLLLKDLTGLIGVESFEDSKGRVSVSVGGGKPLVEGISAWTLTTETDPASGMKRISWRDNDGNLTDITDNISGGELKGLIEVRDTYIPNYMNRLNELATGLRDAVNAVHSVLEDNVTGLPVAGIDFFVGAPDTQTFAVNPDIINDISKIAASKYATPLAGDNSHAIAIAALQQQLTMGGNTTTFDDYYNSMVGEVGGDVQSAAVNSDHRTAVIESMQTFRESVSGVSLDEEMVKMIQFQHAYEAAAKLITTVDKMLETVINLV